MTNADKIRSMTDEELAVLLADTDGDFPPHMERCTIDQAVKFWLIWLKQEDA